MYCPKCGQLNDDNNFKCAKCSHVLHPSGRSVYEPAGGDSLEGLVPYRNTYALIAYYLAVFSLIPCVGVLLGIPAFFLGLRGLKSFRENPAAKGKVHAWIGVIMGGICGLGNLVLIILMIISAKMK